MPPSRPTNSLDPPTLLLAAGVLLVLLASFGGKTFGTGGAMAKGPAPGSSSSPHKHIGGVKYEARRATQKSKMTIKVPPEYTRSK